MQGNHRLAAAAVALIAMLAFDSQAQTRYSVYVDSDDNAATGCALSLPGGSFTGADARLEALIATGASPSVTSLSLSACSGGVFPAGSVIGGGYPVGTNNGTGGADVVELAGPLAQLSTRGRARVRLAFASDNGVGSDLLATRTGLAGAPPIFLGVPITVPTLGWAAMLLMGLAMVLVATRFGRKALLARVIGASLLASSGIGLAANFILDGAVGDWTTGPLATDPLADSSDGSAVVDIVAGFGAVENETVFFRIDAAELQNQPPVVTPVAVATNEDNAVTVNLSATDPEGQPVSFAIVSGPANGSLGALTQLPPNAASVLYTPNADFFGADSFTVSANDGQATSAPATVSITVNPVNDVPVFTVGPDVTVLKDTGAQTINPWASAISAGPANESGQTLNFLIASNDNPALFSAGPAISPTGVLSFTGVADANGTANISVQLQDNGGTANGGIDTSAVQTFSITLTGVNDPPSFTAGPDQTVLEDAGAQTVNPWATAISAGPPDEVGQLLTFNVTGNTNPALFSAGPTVSPTGVLSYTPAANANGSASITLTLQDNGGTANGGSDTSAAQTLVINVTAVNDVPVFTAQDPPAVNEDAGVQSALVATAISAGPPDESAQTLAFSITNNSNPGLFNGAPTISSAGLLSYTPAANTSGSAVLTFRLQDNGGTANGGVDTSATQTVTVTVNSVNDVPSFTAGANQSVNEDAGAQTINPWATGISAGPPDESGQTLSFNITGNTNPALFSAGPTLSPAGVLTYTPAADAFGVATITLNLQDNGGTANGGIDTSAAQSFTITVLAVNDVPSFAVGPDVAVAVGAGAQTFNPWATAISAGPPNEAGQTLSFAITANSNPGLFSVAPAISPAGVLSFTGSGSGSAALSLRIQDNGGTANGGVDTSATQNFSITIDSPPSVTATTPTPAALVPDNQALSVSFSENITTVIGNAVTLSCNGGPDLITGGATGTGVTVLNPTYAAPLPAGNCVLTVIAANVTDSDSIDPPNNMAANVLVNFSVDAAPAVNSISPVNGSSNQSTSAPVVIAFSESVAATGSAFSVECPVGSPVAFTTSASPAASYTLTPVTAWTGGATCTVTVVANQISDSDAVDPPNLMLANFVSSFGTDAAPTVTGGLPANGASNVATNTAVSFTFSENVDAGPGAAITLNCGAAIAGSITGNGTSTLTFTPSVALPAGSACTATAVAANIGDSDLFDPPNNLAANVVRNFTTDAPPVLTSSLPANGATAQPATGTITLNFSESVNFDTTANAANLSFDLECPGGTPANFSVLTASPAASVVLDPLDSALAGRTCSLILRSAAITDADLGDPPDTLPADVPLTMAFAGVAVDD
ncbi:MAG: tandem-95 repeat protein, partial [Lysobacterales bacterium]